MLLVIDVSGLDGRPRRQREAKLELAKRAAIKALPQFAPDDKVGLWMFSTEPAVDKDYLELCRSAAVGRTAQRVAARLERR